MSAITQNPFANANLYKQLEKPVEGQPKDGIDPALQKMLGGYTAKQLEGLKGVKLDNFRSMVNYINPKNKGAVRFKSDLTLEKCNNKVDIGSWRPGLNAKKNRLMRMTFANALKPGLRFIADEDKLNKLMAVVTGTKLGKSERLLKSGWKFGDDTIEMKEGKGFSAKHLERKEVRDALLIYDEAFNTPEGRKNTVEALLRAKGWKPSEEDRNTFCLRTVGRSFNQLFSPQMFKNDLEETAFIVDDENKWKDTDFLKGGYMGMMVSSKAFLTRMDEVCKKFEHAGAEQELAKKINDLVQNYEVKEGTFSLDKALCNELSGALWKSVLNRLPDGVMEQFTLGAYTGSIGGKDPMNIFVETLLKGTLNKLVKKYAADAKPGQKVGMQIYNKLVQIATNYIQAVKILKDKAVAFNDKDYAPVVDPKNFNLAKDLENQKKEKEPKLKIFNPFSEETMDNIRKEGFKLVPFTFSINTDKIKVGSNISQMLLGMKTYHEIQNASDENFIEYAKTYGVEVAAEQCKGLKATWLNLLLEAQVQFLANGFYHYEKLYGEVIDGPKDANKGEQPNVDVYADGEQPILESDEIDIEKYSKDEGVQNLFVKLLKKHIRDTKVALTFQGAGGGVSGLEIIKHAMDEKDWFIDHAIGDDNLLKKFTTFFKSKKEKEADKEFVQLFKDQALKHLLTRYFDDKIKTMASGTGQVNVQFCDLYPVLRYMGEIAERVDSKIDIFRNELKAAIGNVKEFCKDLGMDEADRMELEKEAETKLHEAYKNKVAELLADVFEKVDIERVNQENPDALDLPKKVAKELTEKLGTSIDEFANQASQKMKDVLTGVYEKHSAAFKGLLTRVRRSEKNLVNEGINILKAPSSPEDGESPLELKISEDKDVKNILLFQPSGNDFNGKLSTILKTRCSDIVNHTAIKNFSKYTAAGEKERKEMSEALANDVKTTFEATVKSMRTYAAGISAAILKNVKDKIKADPDIKKLIDSKSPLADKVVDHLAHKILFNGATTIEDVIIKHLEAAYSVKLEAGKKVVLPKFDEKAGDRAFADFSDTLKTKLGVQIKEELVHIQTVGEEIRDKFVPEVDIQAEDVFDRNDKVEKEIYDFYQTLTTDKISSEYPNLVPMIGTVDKYGMNDVQKAFLANWISEVKDDESLTKLSTIEIAVLGKDGFKGRLIEMYKKELTGGGRFEKFKNYVKDCNEFFGKEKNLYNLPDKHLVDSKRTAFFGSSDAVDYSEWGSGRKTVQNFDVEQVKSRYRREALNVVANAVRKNQADAQGAKEVLGNMFKYIQGRVEASVYGWIDEGGAIADERNQMLRVTLKAVLPKLITKATVEFTNRIWSVEEGDVLQSVPVDDLSKFNYNEYWDQKVKDLENREDADLDRIADRVTKMVDKLDDFVGVVLGGTRDKVGSKNALYDFIYAFYLKEKPAETPEEFNKQLEKLNPRQKQDLQYLREEKTTLTEWLGQTLLDSPRYYEAMTESVVQYWNKCCAEGVFAQFAEKAGIDEALVTEMKPIEVKPAEKPVEKTEDKVEEKPGIMDKGSFNVDTNSGGVAMKRLEEFVKASIGMSLTTKLANESMAGDSFMVAAEMLLQDKKFIRETFGKVMKFEIKNESTWKDIETAVRKVFLKRVRDALETSIDKAMNNKDERISFDPVAAITIENKDFEEALAAIAKARWATFSATDWSTLSNEAKKPIVEKLDAYLGVPEHNFNPVLGEEGGVVASMCTRAAAGKGAIISEIVSKIPLEAILKEDQMTKFLQTGELPEEQSVVDIVGKWLDKAIGEKETWEKERKLGRVVVDPLGEIDEMVKSGKVNARETLLDSLAGYKGFIKNSVDSIRTTRICLTGKFGRNFAFDAGFKQLFQSDPFTDDALGTDKTRSGLPAPDGSYEFIESYDAFVKHVSQYLERSDVQETLNGNFDKIENLFGHHGLWPNRTLAVFDFIDTREGGILRTGGMVHELHGVLTKFGDLFTTGLSARMKIKQAQYDADAKIFTDTHEMEKWLANKHRDLAEKFKNIDNKVAREQKIDQQTRKELDEIWSRVSAFNLGLDEKETSDICGMMLEGVISALKTSRMAKKEQTKVKAGGVVDWASQEFFENFFENSFSKKLGLTKTEGLEIKETIKKSFLELSGKLDTLTNPDPTQRNNFCGFTTKFRILRSVVNANAKAKADDNADSAKKKVDDFFQ